MQKKDQIMKINKFDILKQKFLNQKNKDTSTFQKSNLFKMSKMSMKARIIQKFVKNLIFQVKNK